LVRSPRPLTKQTGRRDGRIGFKNEIDIGKNFIHHGNMHKSFGQGIPKEIPDDIIKKYLGNYNI